MATCSVLSSVVIVVGWTAPQAAMASRLAAARGRATQRNTIVMARRLWPRRPAEHRDHPRTSPEATSGQRLGRWLVGGACLGMEGLVHRLRRPQAKSWHRRDVRDRRRPQLPD